MNFPFEFSASYVGTPIIKKIFDDTDNLVLAGIISQATFNAANDFSLVKPAGSFWLTSFRLTVDVAAKLDIGIYNATDFISLYPDLGSYAAAGGVVRQMEQSGPQFPHNTGLWRAAIRITGAVNPTTIRVTGDIGFSPRS